MKVEPEHFLVLVLIVYIAFFSHPPPQFISQVLDNPVGQLLVLVGVLYTFMKKPLVGLFLGIAYLVSSYPTLEYLDPKEQKEEKPQPKSGAPKVDVAQIGKLAQMLGKGSKLPTQKGKDVTEKPPETQPVKPHVDPKVTEKFTSF
jgi:hypothetical protein